MKFGGSEVNINPQPSIQILKLSYRNPKSSLNLPSLMSWGPPSKASWSGDLSVSPRTMMYLSLFLESLDFVKKGRFTCSILRITVESRSATCHSIQHCWHSPLPTQSPTSHKQKLVVYAYRLATCLLSLLTSISHTSTVCCVQFFFGLLCSTILENVICIHQSFFLSAFDLTYRTNYLRYIHQSSW